MNLEFPYFHIIRSIFWPLGTPPGLPAGSLCRAFPYDFAYITWKVEKNFGEVVYARPNVRPGGLLFPFI